MSRWVTCAVGLISCACSGVVGDSDPEFEELGEASEQLIAEDFIANTYGEAKTSLSASEGNLSSGALDWAHFESPTKINGGSFDGIKNFKRLGSGPYAQIPTGPLAFSWSGGAPTATGNDVRSHVRACGPGAGFSFEVPSVAKGRTIKLFAGAHNAAVDFWVYRTNADGSVSGASPGATLQNPSGSTFGYYTTNYGTLDPRPVRLEIKVKQAGNTPITNNSCVSLLAARLTAVPTGSATISFVGPYSPAFEGFAYEVVVNATHTNNGVRGVELFYDNKKIGEALSPPYRFWPLIHAGPGKLHAEVTSMYGTSIKSNAISVTGWYHLGNNGVETIPDVGGWIEGALSPTTPVTGKTVKAAAARVWVEHSYIGDLEMKVVSPNDKAVMLVQNTGGAGQEFAFTEFIDSAQTPITAGFSPFSGEYKPLQPLSGLIGQPFKGNKPWRLSIRDTWANDDGQVNLRDIWVLLD